MTISSSVWSAQHSNAGRNINWRPLEPSHQGWTPLSFMIVKIHLQVLAIIVNNSWIRFVNQLIHPYLVLTNLDTLNNLRHQVHSLVFLFHLFGLIFFRLCGYVAVHWNQQNHHQESFTMTISLNLRLERSNCLPNFFLQQTDAKMLGIARCSTSNFEKLTQGARILLYYEINFYSLSKHFYYVLDPFIHPYNPLRIVIFFLFF